MAKKQKVVLCCILIVLLGVFAFSGWVLVDYWLTSRHQQQEHELLRELKQEGESQVESLPSHVTVTDPDTGAERSVLREYAALYARNSDLVGWISIDGTRVDYPVVQSDRKDYYLRRDFDKKQAIHGSIYVWEEADVFAPSDNVTLFGHRMNDGTMFYDLLNYADADFRREHPSIHFNTLEENGEYEVFAAFRTSGTGGEGFAYHTFVNAADEAEFNAFVDRCRELSFYDTGIVPQFGEKLLTLSTCDYALENGRMVVVGRRIALD